MRQRWERKPGDRVIRVQRLPRYHLKRVLGVPGLWATAYGDLGSSIYYALGIVALVAMGATPIVLGIAGIVFVFNALTYAEGVAMLPESGGSSSFARHGFGELVGFISGWALMFNYVVTIAISAYTIPSYLGYFWEPMKTSALLGTATSMGVVFSLMSLNVLGVRESSLLSLTMAVLDVATQIFLVALGLVFLFSPHLISLNITMHWPTTANFFFGIAVAAIAYTGVETISQLAEETRRPQVRGPRALILTMFTVLLIYAGISLVAFSVMSPEELSRDWARDPIAGIANYLPAQLALKTPADPALSILYTWFVGGLSRFLPLLVAVLAPTILLIATNAGILGISRISHSLAEHRELPSLFGHIHHRFQTPYVAIVLFCGMAILVLLPGLFFPNIFILLGGLYAFGSLLVFALAHASILSLRLREPGRPRPFKLGWNVHLMGRQFPIVALLGLLSTVSIWVLLLIHQPHTRWLGFAWMALGMIIYMVYRHQAHLPILGMVRRLRGAPASPSSPKDQ